MDRHSPTPCMARPLSPTPWRVVEHTDDFAASVVSQSGEVAICARGADAAYIVEAVNDYEWAIGEIHKMTVEYDELFDEAVEIHKERDRLRDLVRRLADSLGVAMYALRASALFPGPPPDQPHDYMNGVDITALLDEAREVLGEGEQ